MAKWSKSSINVSSDEVASQSSFLMGSDEAFSHSSINKGSDETFSGSSIFKGSDETYDIFCIPCQEIEKKLLPADGYCINCKEHLCFDCCSNHRKNKTSRQHKLQDKHTMPQSKPVATSSTKRDKHRVPLSKQVATSSTKEDKHQAPQSKPVATKRSSKTAITSLQPAVAKGSTPREINARSSTDNKRCWMTGMALLPDSQLVITDNNNWKVKLVDIRHCKIVSELSLDAPWDITSVQDVRLAVTLPFVQKIQFLTISSHTLSKDSDISVNGQCYGIAYNDKDLIVTFIDPGKVEIIRLSGELIRSIKMDNNGARIFERPYYVALTNDNTGMYASDQDNHSVTFLTLDGNVKYVYKNKTLQYSQGLCVDQSGRVFVADIYGTVLQLVPGTDNQLVPGTDKLQPLLDQTHGVSDRPYSLAYCDREDKLYVGMQLCDVLNVFQLQ